MGENTECKYAFSMYLYITKPYHLFVSGHDSQPFRLAIKNKILLL
jgi:hypothetical protein